MKFIDITGQRFGRLIAVKYLGNSKWKCQCDCGIEHIATGSNLRNGSIKSCGCLNIEKILERNKIKKLNTYDLSNEYGIGYDCNGIEFYFDIQDYNLIKDYTWRVNQTGYAETTIDGKFVKQHRVLIDVPEQLDVDHINGIRNDNRRSNLRVVTKSENNKNRKLNDNNSTGAKGVCKLPNGKYHARIQFNGTRMSIGTFNTIKQAADAYDQKAIELFGEFARLNNYNEN